ATASTQASDNNLPGPKVCATCHREGGPAPAITPAIKQPRASIVTKFNHALHSKLGNIAPVLARALDNDSYLSRPPDAMRKDLNTKEACAACHRGLPQSDEVTAAHFPAMADCLVCHNKVDPPFSCTKCHDSGAALRPANHTKDWLERHSSKGQITDKLSCAVCHGRQCTCLGCH
ncbi:MAG TPA: hypothetical protein VEQ63_07255, partial [Bryobacteraceae bacterium]|nr:hypothetical protein [Bryobacteraceae bacterium]